jgi:hypothetical protein
MFTRAHNWLNDGAVKPHHVELSAVSIGRLACEYDVRSALRPAWFSSLLSETHNRAGLACDQVKDMYCGNCALVEWTDCKLINYR